MHYRKFFKHWLCAGLALLFPLGAQASVQDLAWQDGIPAYQEVKGSITHDGPKLIFSDSPEMVGKIGIMYRDTVEGPVRLFFHHVNDTRTDKRLAVLLRRTTLRPSQVAFGRTGISRPNEDWLEAGKEAQERYYSSVPNGRKFLLNGPRDILNNGKGYILHPQELVTGIVDLTFDKPVEVSFIMMPVEADPRISAEVYSVLPPDQGGHVLRGTFEGANAHVTLADSFDTDAGVIWGMELADDSKDLYLRGTDVTRNAPVVNYGNYGVMYDVNFRTHGKNAAQLRFNPYGGPYAGEGILAVEGEPARYLRIPESSLSFGWDHDGETMKLGTVPPGKSGSFYFSPPGSSNLPVRIFWEGKAGSRLEEKSGKVRTAEQILAERLARKEHKENSTKRK